MSVTAKEMKDFVKQSERDVSPICKIIKVEYEEHVLTVVSER